MPDLNTAAALWGAVVLSGVYHGANPGMGWPLAVSAALMDRRQASLFRALAALAGGHFLAMAVVLAPFTAMLALAEWQRAIQLGAAVLVTGMGLYLLINRRHPRMLARVPPSRLALWSALAATAHGAGLMLVPIFLGICDVNADAGHAAADAILRGNAGTLLAVAAAHTAAMTVAGGAIAVGVYRWLGLKFLSRSWFNLDLIWALSLVAVGAVSLALAV